MSGTNRRFELAAKRREELRELLATMPVKAIAAKYGISRQRVWVIARSAGPEVDAGYTGPPAASQRTGLGVVPTAKERDREMEEVVERMREPTSE